LQIKNQRKGFALSLIRHRHKKKSRTKTPLTPSVGVVGVVTDNCLDILGSNAGEIKILRYRSDQPWGAASVLYNVYRVFPGVEAAGHCVDHTPQSSAEAKESIELYLYFPSGPSCLF
jgi:hypothetical protein